MNTFILTAFAKLCFEIAYTYDFCVLLIILCVFTNTHIYIHTGGAKSRKQSNRYLVKTVCI